MVWKYAGAGIRHCITKLRRQRRYHEIDRMTHKLVDTLVDESEARKYRVHGSPVNGEGGSLTRFSGRFYIPPLGNPSFSVANMESKRPFTISLTPCLTDETHWLRNIRHLGLQLAPQSEFLEESQIYISFRTARKESQDLETLYLVSYRDPSCPYGAPRSWTNFPREQLEEHYFLPIPAFVKYHPLPIKCYYIMEATRNFLVEGEELADNKVVNNGTWDVSMALMVDPY
ncbi:hypothetical protein F4810DRAFT_272089 [Camillea tinctor]|nr:hypothetical protein F4810DRAFT_272089 [Camillea tinctor]